MAWKWAWGDGCSFDVGWGTDGSGGEIQKGRKGEGTPGLEGGRGKHIENGSLEFLRVAVSEAVMEQAV